MAKDLTPYVGNKIARWLGGQAMPPPPSSLEVAIYNGNPKSSGVEVTNDINSSGRITVTWVVPASGTDNELTNDDPVDFGNSENNVDFSHVAIFDGDGNMIAAKAIPGGPFSITAGSQVRFNSGGITFVFGSAT
jgi:hypothetical protein